MARISLSQQHVGNGTRHRIIEAAAFVVCTHYLDRKKLRSRVAEAVHTVTIAVIKIIFAIN